MLQESQDLLIEARDLDALLDRLSDAQWDTPTTFMEWTPWDVVAHLHFFDLVSLAALEGEDAFARERDPIVKNMLSGVPHKAMARERFAGIGPAERKRQRKRKKVE